MLRRAWMRLAARAVPRARACEAVGNMCNHRVHRRIGAIPSVRKIEGTWPVYEIEHPEATAIARQLAAMNLEIRTVEPAVLQVAPPLDQPYHKTELALTALEREIQRRTPPPAPPEVVVGAAELCRSELPPYEPATAVAAVAD